MALLTAPPGRNHQMPNLSPEPPAMRMGNCPYCERAVLVYEDPPRCPICACPLDDRQMRPFVFPADHAGDAAEHEDR